MPIAIWPPGNPVRFSYWTADKKRNDRNRRRVLGIVIDASYRGSGHVEIQALADLSTHRFEFCESGDYADDAFPQGDGHGEPVEVHAPDVIAYIDAWPSDQPKPPREKAHPKVIEYLRKIGREDFLV